MDRFASLAAFTRVVESGGFTAAARRLDMSPTMVSEHVKALEDGLGVRLLNRTTRKVSLTEIGREYYERSAQILHDLNEADEIASALQLTARGQLRIHCQTAVAWFIAPVVAAFLRDNREVSVDLRTGDQLIDLLEGGFDLAIRTYMPPDSSLVARPLAQWRHALCCSPSYLAAHPAPRSPADLAQHNCIRYAFYAFGDEWRFVDAAGKPVHVRVHGNLVTTSVETLRTAALRGCGLFLAPPFLVHDELANGSLLRLLPGYQGVEFSVTALYAHRRHMAAKMRAFLDALVARFAGQQWLQANG